LQQKRKKYGLTDARILDVIRFLAKQNLPFQGHRESVECEAVGGVDNRGNFFGAGESVGKIQPVMREHITKVKMKKLVTGLSE